MQYTMENVLPVLYQEIARCYILGEDFEESEIDIALCTTAGQLLELSFSRVVNSCNIKCEDALKIVHFQSYTPLRKYYLICCTSQIVVVSRSKRLEVIKRFNNVIDFEVTDFLRTGTPQIVITVSGSDEPIVTDFSEAVVCNTSDTGPTVLPEISLTLSAKLQEMCVRLEKAKKLLKEKQQCRNNTIGQFLHASTCKTHKDVEVPLQVGMPWQRVHENQWILGVPLYNPQQRSVQNVNLLLSVDKDAVNKLVYKTFLIVFNKKDAKCVGVTDTTALPFQHMTHIMGNATAVLTGVIDIPKLTKVNVVRLTGSVTFEEQDNLSGGIRQIPFPSVELTAIDLVLGKLRTFINKEVTVCDIVSVVVASQSNIFDIHLEHVTELCLNDILEQYFGFRYLPSINCYICQHQSSASGTMVILHQHTQQDYTLHIYSRGEEQALLFVHSLYSILPDQSKISLQKNVKKSLCSAVNSLNSELKLLLSVLNIIRKNLPLSQSAVNLTREQWQSIYSKILKAESVTDSLFRDNLDISQIV